MSLNRALVVLATLTLSLPTSAEGQAGACNVNIDSTHGIGQRFRVPGGFHSFGNGGVWTSCIGRPTKMYSDSMAGYTERQRLDMVGNVRFQDESVILTSDRATYFLDDQRLEATGDVILTNIITGSELRGPNLRYLRAVAGVRDSVEIFATGRPTVTYRSFGSAPSDEPYIIIGDRMHMLGGSNAWAGGNVTIDRTDFESQSDSAQLNTGGGQGTLVGNAQMVGGDSVSYILTGESIAFRSENDVIEWIQARDSANAVGDTWQLRGDTVDFQFNDGTVEKAMAWGRAIETTASADDYQIRADSIEIDMPDQVLTEVRGYFNSIATAVTDSLTDADWIAGDTVTAHFDELSEGDRGLSFLRAIGNAAALYKIQSEETGPVPGINYSRGDRILVRFDEVGIKDLTVDGEADGVHLEPIGNAQ